MVEESNHLHSRRLQIAYTAATVNPTEGITYSEARSLMAAKSSPEGFVVATVTNPGSFMATITHPPGSFMATITHPPGSFMATMTHPPD